MKTPLPPDYDPRTICISVDVEWASADVLADLRTLFDERGLRATFFATHEDVSVPGHERGIHPNFRRGGDIVKALAAAGDTGAPPDEAAFYRQVVARFKSFAPEAKGVRGHSLHYDSLLLPAYEAHGIEYDSTYQMPLVDQIKPFWKENDILELPIFLNDFFELKSNALGFDAGRIDLDAPGLKVFNMHPNTMFLNASSLAHYDANRRHYHDAERLLEARHRGPGVRTMMIDLLDRIVAKALPTKTLGEVNAMFRSHPKFGTPQGFSAKQR